MSVIMMNENHLEQVEVMENLFKLSHIIINPGRFKYTQVHRG